MHGPVLKYFTALGVLFFVLPGCQNKPNQDDRLTSIEFLRGDITLCGSQNFGEVNFALSSSPEASKKFDLALALLHSFEYDEAEKAFVQVIDQDPACVMAYWGVAMSNFHSLWLQSGTDYLKKGADILKASESLEKTEREKDYLNAIAAFYQEWESLDRKTRVKDFEWAMEALYKKYPEDKEAAIFYALALRASADPTDKTYQNQLKSGEILTSIFPDQPNHPGIAHYLIHNYDYPELAEHGLATARKYAQIAPSSAHAQHMPSHIFTRLGLWDESIQTNLNSTASARCYAESLGQDIHWDEELHGMDYLVYAYLQLSDTQSAVQQEVYLNTFRKVTPANFKVAYTAAAIPTRIALETRNWELASNLRRPNLEIDWNPFPWQAAMLHFGRALGAIHLNKLALTESELERMKALQKQLTETKEAYQANQVHIQIKIIMAWLEEARDHDEEALRLMKEAVVMENNTVKHPVTPGEVLPAEELLGDLYMKIGRPKMALTVYEQNLNQRPNRFNGLYGAAQAAAAINNDEKATTYYKLLLAQTKPGASDRIELVQARKYLTKNLAKREVDG